MSSGLPSRILLVLVAVALVAVVIRLSEARSGSAALLRVGTKDVGALRHEAFQLDAPARLAVSAAGSFESDSVLAAYGWIVRRADRAVVWQMTPDRVARGRGTLALAEDTLALEPGVYDAYFATYGDPDARGAGRPGRVRRPWGSDRSKWHFALTATDEGAGHGFRRLDRADREAAAPGGPDLLWGSGAVGVGGYEAYGFEVRQPVSLRLYAQGEVRGGEARDVAWIDDLSTGRRVWTFSEGNTDPGGGAARNRKFNGTLRLPPGLYRAVYQGDGEHGPGAWVGNPPLDPMAYGLFLFTPDANAVGTLDPWGRLPRLLEMAPLGNNVDRQAEFTLADSLRVWVYAVGELSSSGSRWDYADLFREGERVWEMSRADSRPAGGADRNRIAEAYLALPPGRYTLRVRTDGSHSFGSWSGEAPHHPERWGVTVFALSPDFRPETVAVEEPGAPEAPPPPDLPSAGQAELPIRLAPLGNDQRVARTFRLEEETTLRVHAVGEIIRSERYDYGRILDESGEVVWEMTRENTEHAGGASKNRRFLGPVSLPAGTYTVEFVSDGSHAFGDFRGDGPDEPSAWGITVEAQP
jgi:hypothetical protein